MSITRLQQARQMYALGKLVERVGFQGGGRDAGAGSGFGGSSNNNNTGGGGGSTNREKGIMSRGLGPKGTTGNINDFDDRGGVDRSAVSQFSTYGKNVMNQNLKGPGLFSRIGDGIGNYIKGGGLLGMGIRGLTGLIDKFTGPKATEYGNLNIPGYNMLNIAGPKEYDFGPKGGDGEDSNLYATTNQYPITGTIPEEGIISLLNSMPQDPFESRYLQSQPQDIREAIEASMQNYYT